jgi:hypothetical protein
MHHTVTGDCDVRGVFNGLIKTYPPPTVILGNSENLNQCLSMLGIVRLTHDNLGQKPLCQRCFHEPIHWHIWLYQNCLCSLVELKHVIQRANIDDLVALARGLSC